ncbi:MAG: non-heme chloroperoxidase [Cellvibrionaceae bacterium]|jgi:non-heme chloroperoxidase
MFWIILIALIAIVWFFMKRNVDKIKQNAERYPLSQLSQDPQGETVMIDRPDGGRIRAKVAGEGDTVVLAHGYGIELLEWNVIMDQLANNGYRVIAFDQMGHGKSTIGSDGVGAMQMAASYKLVLEHFDVQNGVLVGHSMGGFLSISTLLNFPEVTERLKGLVLFASTAGDVSKGAPQNKIQVPLIKSGIMTALIKSDLIGYPFGASLMGINPYASAIRVFVDSFLAQDHSKLIPILKAMDETSYYDRLGEINVPTVVVCGKKDGTTPPWHSESLGRDIPNARNVWVPDRGHMLNWEAPEALIKVVSELHGKAAV